MPIKINNELDILVLIKKLWSARKVLYIGLSIGVIIGLFLAFASPKQYKVITTMLPQSEDGGGMGSISSLAAIAGFDIDLSDNGSEISPAIYPQIFESEPFLLSLMYSNFTFDKVNRPVSLYEYITKIQKPTFGQKLQLYTVGFPSLLKNLLKGNKANTSIKQNNTTGITRLTEKESEIANMLKMNVTLSINKKEGYLTLTSISDNASLAAQLAKRAQELLQETITKQKTKRAVDQLEFFENRYNEKKKEYESALKRLANYKDQNQFVTSAVGSSIQDKLQNDFNLTFSVYSELAKQLENARIKVKRVTPVYLILKPVVEPLEPFAPKKTVIMIVSLLFGFLTSCGYILFKEYLKILGVKKNSTTE